MSKLYIRVRTNFYTHKKTVRLRRLIGNDAYWLPPRLWAYAAENQPDGDLTGYDSDELSELVGYVKDASSNATSMLQALKDAGFVDEDNRIHDWEEHNGYHQKYSERAKNAAVARWSKDKTKENPPTPPLKEERGNRKVESGVSIAQAMLVASKTRTFDTNVPTIAEVKSLAAMRGVSSESAQRFFDHHEGNNLWVNQHGRLINWQQKLVTWGVNDRSNPPKVAAPAPATKPLGYIPDAIIK